MIHIVFNEADVYTINQVIELDETLTGDVVQIKDDLAVGPLTNIFETEGIQARKDWWQRVLVGGDGDMTESTQVVDDEATFTALLEKLNTTDEDIWIWCAQNKHDVCGYYWLMSRLKEYQGRIYFIYLNNLPFINEKGQVFYPKWLHEIRPSEFLKAKKLARKITLSEFEVDPDEWTKLYSDEEAGIRLLEGGKKLISKPIDFYDNDILAFVSKEPQKVSRVVNNYLNKAAHQTGDYFILWRIKELIAAEKLIATGSVAKMKDFEIKLPTTQE